MTQALRSHNKTKNMLSFTVIEEANWLTLQNDVNHVLKDGFDAVICLGNSFAHMMDSFGDQREQKLVIWFENIFCNH